ncbi:GntR family transcriptional regulator [Geothrix sp. 21YS21S-4]|uniref:GntR family transcriptional regulator n=1 Tax=Geothrix sp. 21YS21S-4 TaxID=3068889 RepID=UPI0027BA61D5|nr:GntR family transcriptional regulator [Geothrix sp. 21YS21S-4]
MLDPESRMPLYHQVENHLREAIRRGRWKVGEAIPPERILIEQYGVSRITIRQALTNLVAAGWLVRKHGRGTFVAGEEDRPITESLASLTGHIEELQGRGLDPRIEVLALETRTMDDDVAEALQRRPGSEGWYVHRLVSVDDLPLMLSTVWLPCDLGIGLTRALAKAEGMIPLLIRHGLMPRFGRQRIGAMKAGSQEARLLGIRSGEAVLRVSRILHGEDSQPLVWFRTLYRADRYEYDIELRRMGARP